MQVRPCVTVIIVSYFSKPHIEDCIQSIVNTAGNWVRDIRVVDNASGDGTVAFIRGSFPQVNIFANTDNLGFSKACNIGAAGAETDYLLFMNPDARLQAAALQELVKFMDSRANAAAAGPRIENERGEFQISSRRGFPTPMNSFGRLFGFERWMPNGKFGSYSLLHIPPERELLADSISGACMLVRTEDYRNVGGFDEDYFLFGEDIDLCWKFSEANREVWYIPSARAVHIKGASVRFNFDRSRREFFRAMDIYIDKRLHGHYSLFSCIMMKIGMRLRRALDPFMRNS